VVEKVGDPLQRNPFDAVFGSVLAHIWQQPADLVQAQAQLAAWDGAPGAGHASENAFIDSQQLELLICSPELSCESINAF
jgi:hypothetical protein